MWISLQHATPCFCPSREDQSDEVEVDDEVELTAEENGVFIVTSSADRATSDRNLVHINYQRRFL